MSERDGFEHGVPCWVAGVHPDPSAAASFYGDLFGWQPARRSAAMSSAACAAVR